MQQQKQNYFKEEFKKIIEFKQRGECSTSVREAGRIFEELLRQIIQEYLSQVNFSTRKAIFDAEMEIGKGTKGIADFQFGQLVGIWRGCRLIDVVEDLEGRSARTLKGIDLNIICELRNDCIHNAHIPDEHDIEYVMSSLRTYLTYFGISLSESTGQIPRSIAEVSDLLRERFSSVEVIEGTSAFYRRLTEIISRPEVDTYDLTFLVEKPPSLPKVRPQNDPAKEYFDLIRKRVVNNEARLRRIITFNNPAKSAWILFHLVGAHHEVFEENMILAYFDAMRSNQVCDIMLPNIAMYYPGDNPNDGIAWLYSHQQYIHQNFIGLSGSNLFNTMRRIYINWFKSCDLLTEEKAFQQFTKIFGQVKNVQEIRSIAEKYYEAILLNDDELNKSVNYWSHLFKKYDVDGTYTEEHRRTTRKLSLNTFNSEDEQLYYEKLREVWEDEILEDHEKEELDTLVEVLSIPHERTVELEEMVKKELGIIQVNEKSFNSYIKLLETFSRKGIIDENQRALLHKKAETFGIPSHVSVEMEASLYYKKGLELKENGNKKESLIFFKTASSLIPSCENYRKEYELMIGE